MFDLKCKVYQEEEKEMWFLHCIVENLVKTKMKQTYI